MSFHPHIAYNCPSQEHMYPHIVCNMCSWFLAQVQIFFNFERSPCGWYAASTRPVLPEILTLMMHLMMWYHYLWLRYVRTRHTCVLKCVTHGSTNSVNSAKVPEIVVLTHGAYASQHNSFRIFELRYATLTSKVKKLIFTLLQALIETCLELGFDYFIKLVVLLAFNSIANEIPWCQIMDRSSALFVASCIVLQSPCR